MDNIKDSYDILNTNENIKNIFGNTFVYNDYQNGKQVISNLTSNLIDCDEFIFSVAFINDSGLAKLKLELKELERQNIKGKILTTNYLFFSEPKALRELLELTNVEVKMYYLDNQSSAGFHTKGYIFRKKDDYKVIIGSSNITQNALTINKEWNTEITGSKDAIAIQNILNEFNSMWENSKSLQEVIGSYEEEYEKYHTVHKENETPIYQIIKPNAMQMMFINRLNELVNNNQKRALLISATGTGKTYASAFGVKYLEKFKVKKLLFICHREKILSQAADTYQIVFGKDLKAGVYSGTKKNIDGLDFVFASFGMLIKKEYREQFAKDEFDMVIIDEVHKVGDNHYQDIINYFTPKFLLGMSATPDRTDGYDLYKLFDHNIAYELRLMSALESNMLSPFNYYGITDLFVNDLPLDNFADFILLTSDERVKHIIEQAKYYGYSGPRVKGLIFVNRIDVGKELSRKFNLSGYRTVFLDGSVSQSDRNEAISALEEDCVYKKQLDYIFTVDIFNEGVDIPSVNQIILLRPTASSIIFIQQLGRDLRLYKNKEYVNVLDFIGNYANNYCITEALTPGKVTKGELTRVVHDPLPGSSSLHFEKIAKELIYHSIDQAKINGKQHIFNAYRDVKQKLGHIPTLVEFDTYSTVSGDVFLSKQIYKSYYIFLKEKEDEYNVRLNASQELMINYLSNYLFDGKRISDIIALKELIETKRLSFKADTTNILEKYIISILDLSFANDSKITSKINNAFIEIDEYNNISISKEFLFALNNKDFFEFISNLIKYAEYSNQKYNNKDDFKYFNKYTRKDVCRLISNTRNESSTMYGYKFFKDLKELPLFVSYHKLLDDNSSVSYEDTFIDENTFTWYSRNNRTLDSKEIMPILEAYKNNKITIRLFVQKANSDFIKDDDGSFYYLSDCRILNYCNTKMKNGDNVVKFTLKLINPCRDDIYRYLISPL